MTARVKSLTDLKIQVDRVLIENPELSYSGKRVASGRISRQEEESWKTGKMLGNALQEIDLALKLMIKAELPPVLYEVVDDYCMKQIGERLAITRTWQYQELKNALQETDNVKNLYQQRQSDCCRSDPGNSVQG